MPTRPITGSEYRSRYLASNGDLPCQCWCQRIILHVPPAEIRAHRTRSCGRRGCAPPDE